MLLYADTPIKHCRRPAGIRGCKRAVKVPPRDDPELGVRGPTGASL